MAKIPLKPLEDPPSASSSDDDQVQISSGNEEEEEDSWEEEEETVPVSSKPSVSKSKPSVFATKPCISASKPAKSSVSAVKHAVSASGSESESDLKKSETERDSVKAVATTSAKPKKEKTHAASVKAGMKRPGGETSRYTNAKRPALFEKLWSDEDEITLLQGVIDFKREKGKSAFKDSDGFYEFVNNSVSSEFSKTQCINKIRSLKKRYTKKEKNGLEVEPNSHDEMLFKLSTSIWGADGVMGLESVIKPSGVPKMSLRRDNVEPGSTSDWFDNSVLLPTIAGYGLGQQYLRDKWSLVSVDTKNKFEDMWKALQDQELGIVVQKSKFVHELISVIDEASKN